MPKIFVKCGWRAPFGGAVGLKGQKTFRWLSWNCYTNRLNRKRIKAFFSGDEQMGREIQSWWQSPYRSEPNMTEMLDDPIVQLVMDRDRLHKDDVRSLMKDAARRLLLIEKQAA